MFRRHGAILINLLQTVAWLLLLGLPTAGLAISVGNLTFSLGAEESFVAKRVLNNNPSARLYQISVVGIDRPGGNEVRSRPADGELLFAPRQLTLQAGQVKMNFIIMARRIIVNVITGFRFGEIPTRNRIGRTAAGGSVGIDPVVVMETIMVVRPRQVQFKWAFDRQAGSVSNSGNTWFKLLIKPGCDATEEEGEAWYLRPGDVVRQAALRQPGNKIHYL